MKKFHVTFDTVISVLSNGNPDAKRLFDDLLSSYNKLVRPVINVTDPVTVKFKLKLSQLIDVVRVQRSSTIVGSLHSIEPAKASDDDKPLDRAILVRLQAHLEPR